LHCLILWWAAIKKEERSEQRREKKQKQTQTQTHLGFTVEASSKMNQKKG